MKYHICREKMQLSRAKPGNPASGVYGVVVVSSHCVLPRRCTHKEGDIGRIEGNQLAIQEASSEGQYDHTTVYYFHNIILYSNVRLKGL